MSRALGAYRRQLKVVRKDDSGRDCIDFHSFRRSAIRCLENARVPQSEAAQVVGHERAGITFGTYNPEDMDLKALREVIEKRREAIRQSHRKYVEANRVVLRARQAERDRKRRAAIKAGQKET